MQKVMWRWKNYTSQELFCSILYTCTLSSLWVVLSGGLCVSSEPLISQGHPEDYTHSLANWQQIDL